MDFSQPFVVRNESGGKLVIGTLVIEHGYSKEIHPLRYPAETIIRLETMQKLNRIFIEEAEPIQEPEKLVSAEDLQTKEGHEYTIFNPDREKSISVQPVSSGKAVEVTSLTDSEPDVYSDYDRMKATDFLNQHWRKVESEIKKIDQPGRLAFLLEMAEGNEVAPKKIELIKQRIAEI